MEMNNLFYIMWYCLISCIITGIIQYFGYSLNTFIWFLTATIVFFIFGLFKELNIFKDDWLNWLILSNIKKKRTLLEEGKVGVQRKIKLKTNKKENGVTKIFGGLERWKMIIFYLNGLSG